MDFHWCYCCWCMTSIEPPTPQNKNKNKNKQNKQQQQTTNCLPSPLPGRCLYILYIRCIFIVQGLIRYVLDYVINWLGGHSFSGHFVPLFLCVLKGPWHGFFWLWSCWLFFVVFFVFCMDILRKRCWYWILTSWQCFIGCNNLFKKKHFSWVELVWRSPTLYRTAPLGKGLVSHNTWTCANRKYVDDVRII